MFDEAGKNFTMVKSVLEGYYNNKSILEFRRVSTINPIIVSKYVEGLIEEYEKSQPVRKIRASRRSVTGWINGSTNHDPVPFESTIERDCVQQLLFDARIRHVQSQPLTVTFPKDDVENRSYTPDYLVTFVRNGIIEKILIECKSNSEWDKYHDKLSRRYRYVADWAKQRGLGFVLLTEEHVQGHSLHNIKQLVPYRYVAPQDIDEFPQFRRKILSLLPSSNNDLLDQIEPLFPSRQHAQAEILRLLAYQEIYCDLDAPLEMSTMLQSAKTGNEPDFLFDRGVYFDE